MLTANDITRTTKKFDEILSKRHNCSDLTDNLAYQSLNIINQISNTKFPVYLVRSSINKQYYAMKTFPYLGEQPHYSFKNELRFI